MHMYCIPVHTSVGLVWEVNPKCQSFVQTHHTLKQGLWRGVDIAAITAVVGRDAQFPSYSGFVDTHKLCWEAFDGHLALWPSNAHALPWVQLCHHWDPVCVQWPTIKIDTNVNIWAPINCLQGEA